MREESSYKVEKDGAPQCVRIVVLEVRRLFGVGWTAYPPTQLLVYYSSTCKNNGCWFVIDSERIFSQICGSLKGRSTFWEISTQFLIFKCCIFLMHLYYRSHQNLWHHEPYSFEGQSATICLRLCLRNNLRNSAKSAQRLMNFCKICFKDQGSRISGSLPLLKFDKIALKLQ